MRISSKRGITNNVVKLILVLILLFGSIYAYGKVTTGSNKVLECKAHGGRCTATTCDITSEVPALSSKAAGCGTDEICCIPIVQAVDSPDESCIDADKKKKAVGSTCNSLSGASAKYCDAAGKCVDKCVFCSRNPDNSAVCGAKNPFTTDINKNRLFSCSCQSLTDCNKAGDKCVKNYCPDSTYCCAS